MQQKSYLGPGIAVVDMEDAPIDADISANVDFLPAPVRAKRVLGQALTVHKLAYKEGRGESIVSRDDESISSPCGRPLFSTTGSMTEMVSSSR